MVTLSIKWECIYKANDIYVIKQTLLNEHQVGCFQLGAGLSANQFQQIQMAVNQCIQSASYNAYALSYR